MYKQNIVSTNPKAKKSSASSYGLQQSFLLFAVTGQADVSINIFESILI